MGGAWGQNGQNGPNPGGDGPGVAGSDFGALWPRFHWGCRRVLSFSVAVAQADRRDCKTAGENVDWAEDKWQVTAVFPELLNRDITKFASAMQTLVTAVTQMIDAGLMTEETALKIVADVAQRFGQDFDAKTELVAARKEAAARKAKRQAEDSFNLSADERAALQAGRAGAVPAGAEAV